MNEEEEEDEEVKESNEDIKLIKEEIKEVNEVNEVNSSIKKISLVSKLAGLNSPVKIETGYMGNKNAAGHHWKPSEETKAKIKSTRNENFQKMVEFAVQVKQSEPYIALQKTREKQQFIDKAIQDEFGALGNVTLTKIRKATK
jgi:hypothetical protein